MFSTLVLEACRTVVLCSGAPLMVGAIVGLVLAVVQGATQIQEQTVTFVAKLVSIGLVLWLFGTELSALMVDHFRENLGVIARLGRLAE